MKGTGARGGQCLDSSLTSKEEDASPADRHRSRLVPIAVNTTTPADQRASSVLCSQPRPGEATLKFPSLWQRWLRTSQMKGAQKE